MDFSNLVDREKYQVFLFVCPASVPFNFGAHPWFVINKLGEISRWEILFRKVKNKTEWGHLYKNYFPPFQGIEVIPFYEKYFWSGELLGKVEGEEATRIIEFLENSPATYPYKDKFFLSGPNSNTYVQWVLNKFPDLLVKLPWNSFGKDFKVDGL